MDNTSQIGRKSAIRRALPITECGLKFYPITMQDYEIFIQCKDSLTLRLGTLPVKYLTKNYVSAIFALEMDSIKSSDKNKGIFYRLLRLLYLSLRIEMTVEMLNSSIFYVQKQDDIELQHILVKQDEKVVKLTPNDLSFKIIPVIAEQNGIELPDQSANIDLVVANEQKKEIENQKLKLKLDLNDKIASVSYLSRVPEREIDKWTVREFEARYNAIERDKRFMIYGQAEAGGMVSFKNGNPYPSWCFDKIDDSLGGIPLSNFQKNLQGVKEKNN